MKDALGNILELGDIIADIRTSYAWHNVGVIHGGITNGGRIRYIGTRGRKYQAMEKCLIKITDEQLNEYHNRDIAEYEQRIENFPNDIYYEINLTNCHKGFEQFNEIRNLYN